MEKIVEYIDTVSKVQQAARKVVKDLCANPRFKVLDENGEELTVDDLMNLIDFLRINSIRLL